MKLTTAPGRVERPMTLDMPWANSDRPEIPNAYRLQAEDERLYALDQERLRIAAESRVADLERELAEAKANLRDAFSGTSVCDYCDFRAHGSNALDVVRAHGRECQSNPYRAELSDLRGKLEQADAFVADAKRRLGTATCVYCEQTFEVGEWLTRHERHAQHALVCPKHPLRAARPSPKPDALAEKIRLIRAGGYKAIADTLGLIAAELAALRKDGEK